MSDKDGSNKFNVSIGGNVEGDANFSDKDINVNKTVSVDKSGDNIKVGNISGSTGIAIGRNAQANVTQGADSQAFAAIIEELNKLKETHPEIDPLTLVDAQAEVEEIQQKVEEGKVEESWLERKFRALALMGEDILDVVTATAANPALGMVTIVRKVAAKAREEAGLEAVD